MNVVIKYDVHNVWKCLKCLNVLNNAVNQYRDMIAARRHTRKNVGEDMVIMF